MRLEKLSQGIEATESFKNLNFVRYKALLVSGAAELDKDFSK